jgi:hypothetical protein
MYQHLLTVAGVLAVVTPGVQSLPLLLPFFVLVWLELAQFFALV